MFKLKKVELLGFKSFADRTRLEFADGIAGVVGPNGCGKSNLSDAISWVLGEQSARMLRGERMADVIFNGTGTRPPTGMAEVSLTLIDPEYAESGLPEASENSEPDSPSQLAAETPAPSARPPGASGQTEDSRRPAPSLPHRAGEIVVTRRLFRSGESEYLINGETSRLRDIQDLFMGTGLGPESYAIIEQGRIGLILSSKPSDRRAILEEAAGVSKFKTRKRLAEAKLESSRANLARITDILEEVTKQLNSLKRQASKARRHRELQDELRGRLKIVLASRFVALENESRRLQQELSALQDDCAQAGERLEALDREQKAAALHYENLEASLRQSRDSLAESELERQRRTSHLEQIQQQASGLEARSAEAAAEAEQLQHQLGALDRQAAETAFRATELATEFAAATEATATLSSQREELVARLAGEENRMEECRQGLLAAVSNAAEMRNQLIQTEEADQAFERQRARAEAEKAQAEDEFRRLDEQLQALQDAQARGEGALAELNGLSTETAEQREKARAQEASSRTRIENLRQEFSAALARKQTLEESLARHAYSTESVRSLLSREIRDNGRSFRPLGLLADFVEVSPGYEEVVEEFLKHDLECVVVERHEQARTGIALLRTEGSGRSTFFVTRVRGNGHSNHRSDPQINAATGVVARVRDLVRFESRLGLNGDPVLPAIENAFLVENSEAAERLAAEHPECHFLTPDGQHYHHRLVSGGRGSSAGPLAQRRDFRELERRTADLESDLRRSETLLAEEAREAARLCEEFERLTREKLEAEKQALVSSEKLRQARETHSRTKERLAVLSHEAATLDAERRDLLERQATWRSRLAAAAAEQAQSEAEHARTSSLLRDLRAQADRLGEELAQAQARESALDERLRALDRERSRLEAQRDDVRARLARLSEQTQNWHEEQQRMLQEAKTDRARLVEWEAAQAAARQQLRRLEEESHTARARRDELLPEIDAVRSHLDTRREQRTEREVALARLSSDRAHHHEQCRDELNSEPARLLEELPPEGTLEGEALETAEEAARALKARIENLGPVNMMALEELEEAEQRSTFLETQRQDLLASIADTEQAIREIDQVSRQQFMEAFRAINGYFAETFRTLFGGGIGQMRLAEESDPDCGIDIVAQPPGKRLQNVLLLSGGEKALAALALLIAVFRYTPSPFCILDEVDAPLDESNVNRFTRMIREMSRHTQFILITHNKRTMEMARLLYGVTMEEPGVSKMVSVRFEEVAEVPAAVPA